MNPLSWLRVSWRIITDRPRILVIPWWVVFWAPCFLTIVLPIRLFSRITVVFLCHNVGEHESGWLKAAVTRLVLACGHGYIVSSAKERSKLSEWFVHKRITVVHHPSYSVFNSSIVSPNEARKKLGLNNRRILLFFGFVRAYKGLRFLLQAMPLVLQRLDVHLLIAGEFWEERAAYEALIAKLGIATHVTIRDAYITNEEIPDYFQAADLLVMPYVSVTSSGLVPLAFAFSRPVVISAIGALAEVVQDRLTGLLVPPADPQALAAAICDFYEQGMAAVMQEHIRAAEEQFSWKALVDAIESFAASTAEQ